MRCTRNLVCPVWLGPILKHNSVPAPLLVRRLTSESCKKLAKERTSASVLREEKTWIQRFLGPKPMPPRRTLAWYKEVLLICTVFAITGSSTMVVSADMSCLSVKSNCCIPLCYSQLCVISLVTEARPSCCERYSWPGRFNEGRTLVLPDMFPYCHVAHIWSFVSLRWNTFWSALLLSLLRCQNLQPLRNSTRDVG